MIDQKTLNKLQKFTDKTRIMHLEKERYWQREIQSYGEYLYATNRHYIARVKGTMAEVPQHVYPRANVFKSFFFRSDYLGQIFRKDVEAAIEARKIAFSNDLDEDNVTVYDKVFDLDYLRKITDLKPVVNVYFSTEKALVFVAGEFEVLLMMKLLPEGSQKTPLTLHNAKA